MDTASDLTDFDPTRSSLSVADEVSDPVEAADPISFDFSRPVATDTSSDGIYRIPRQTMWYCGRALTPVVEGMAGMETDSTLW